MLRTAIFLILLLPGLCLANQGRILFVKGSVTVERGGKLYRAVRNAKVVEGDTISTGKIGRMHVRMADRTLLSLKPNTQFQIQTYRFSGDRNNAQASNERSAPEREDRSVFRLIKGGFRAVTGLIGKRDRSAFGVSTPVATIGIRGTSFVVNLTDTASNEGLAQALPGIQLAALDNVNLPFMNDGSMSDADAFMLAATTTDGGAAGRLTVGVADGSVILSNANGSLVLENGEFGEVLAGQAPSRLLVPPNDSESAASVSGEDSGDADDSTTDTQVATRIVTQDAGGSNGGNADEPPPNTGDDITIEETEFPESPAALLRRNVSLSSALANEAQTLTLGDAAERLDSNGRVTALVSSVQQGDQRIAAAVQLVNGEVINAGFSPATDLRWGRWGGDVAVELADGSQQIFSATASNVHLIQSVQGDSVPAVPLTGSQSYVVVGNTDPANDSGTVGFLGSASLSANFDTQQVQSAVNLSVDQQLWEASGSGSLGGALANGTPRNVFAGNYQTVLINGSVNGAGDFSGFFTEGAQGAGLSYRLSGAGSAVSGVAAFEAEPSL
ncbi:MAG: FecR family protein [Oceanococcus sp.]